MGRSKGIEISHWKVGSAEAFEAIAQTWTDEELGIEPEARSNKSEQEEPDEIAKCANCDHEVILLDTTVNIKKVIVALCLSVFIVIMCSNYSPH